MTPHLASLLAGLTVLSPVIALGIVPASYQGMTRRPGLAAPYAAAGSIYLVAFSLLGWTAWRFVVAHLGMETLGFPLLIMAFWAVNFLLGLVLAKAPAVKAGLPMLLNGTLAIGSCAVLIQGVPDSFGRAAFTAAGMAAGYLVATLAVAFIRERMTLRIPTILRGWPSLLILCSILWLAARAAGAVLP
jgi:Na+-translocating ferredoxin:NAD+ oxidoreductase RnfA subunit